MLLPLLASLVIFNSPSAPVGLISRLALGAATPPMPILPSGPTVRSGLPLLACCRCSSTTVVIYFSVMLQLALRLQLLHCAQLRFLQYLNQMLVEFALHDQLPVQLSFHCNVQLLVIQFHLLQFLHDL